MTERRAVVNGEGERAPHEPTQRQLAGCPWVSPWGCQCAVRWASRMRAALNPAAQLGKQRGGAGFRQPHPHLLSPQPHSLVR